MGGIENTMLSCLKHLNPDEIKMTVCCFKKGGVLEKAFENENVEVIYIKKTGLISVDFIQMFFVLLFGNYNILHSRFGFTSGGLVIAGKLLRTPVLVSLHNSNPSSLMELKRKKIIYKLLAIHLKIHKWITKNWSSKIIGHSKSNLTEFDKNWRNNNLYQVLYNGVNFSNLETENSNLGKFKDFVNEGDFVLLHIGSFRKQKNHAFLLKGFKSLVENSKRYKLILVGNGTLEKEIADLATKLNITQNIYFAGFDSSVKKYYDVAQLFVFPSFIEGFGNVLIEAQYCSLPICGSNIPALGESTYEPYHQFFFDPYNLNDFEEKLTLIIQDIKSHKIEQTIIEAKYFAQEFSIQKMACQLAELYQLQYNSFFNKTFL